MFEGDQVRILSLLKNSRLAQISAALLLLLIVVSSVAMFRAKTFEVEIDGRSVKLTTIRQTVGEALDSSRLGIFPEDEVSPGRETPVSQDLKVGVIRSVPLSLTVDGQLYATRSPASTVGEALTRLSDTLSLDLKDVDEVNEERTQPLVAGMELEVHRAIPVSFQVDGGLAETEMAPRTVVEALAKMGIILGEWDKVSLPLDHVLQPNDQVKIVRVEVREEQVEGDLPFQVVSQPGDFPTGLPDKIIKKGSNGLQEQIFKLTFEDGVEVNREVLSQQIVKAPVTQVVSRGTQTSVSRGGKSINFKRAYQMKATAYSAPGGRTASGVAAGPGIVAVDPRVIPLGTRLYIEGYGEAVALDTGGAIKGNKVDLHMDTEQECYSWGVRNVVVYVLD